MLTRTGTGEARVDEPHLAVPIVVDPVLGTASGSSLGDGCALDVVRSLLFPLATVITPNLREARLLAGDVDGSDPAELAESLAGFGARAVLITEAQPETGGDWLFDGRRHHHVPGRRHQTGCEHGAGCAHSSALAVLLARGLTLVEAAERSHRIVAEAVRVGAAGIGHGVHPVDVFAALCSDERA